MVVFKSLRNSKKCNKGNINNKSVFFLPLFPKKIFLLQFRQKKDISLVQ